MAQRLLIDTYYAETARNIPLFSGLTLQEKDMFLNGSKVYSYSKEEYLFRQGDPIERCYIVCDGFVREFRTTRDGHEFTLNIHKAGDIFCKTEMFLQDGLHRTNAAAVKNAWVMELPIERFKENLFKHPSVANSLLCSLAKFAFMKQLEVEQQVTMTAPQLLAAFLRQICHTHSLDPRGFILPYNKSLIASRLGMEIETLSRTLPKLKEHGITVKGTHVTFHDAQNSSVQPERGSSSVVPFITPHSDSANLVPWVTYNMDQRRQHI